MILVLVGFGIATYGQTIMRVGNKYTVDSVTYSGSAAFRGYLKNTNPDLYKQFDEAYKLSRIGWGLFGAGLAVIPISVLAMDAVQKRETALITQQSENGKGWTNDKIALLFASQALIGAGVAVSGVMILGFGYRNMHRSVDAYNISRNPESQAFWSINASSYGVGIAYHF